MNGYASKICVSFGFFLGIFLIFHEASARPVFPGWDNFLSVYYESAYLDRARTGAGLLVPKFGVSDPKSGLQIYFTSRVGVDSRTFLEQSDQIYNDNFLFLGAGIDQVSWIPGVRFSLQAGNSIDLNPKINLGGFDVRTGWMSYHEKEWISQGLRTEIYSEALYIRRYRNILGSLHARNFWPILPAGRSRYEGFEFGPSLQFVVSGDSAGFDYNRLFEAQAGVRAQFHTPLAIALHLLGVRGARLDPESPIGRYADFRILITGYYEL